VFPPFKIASWAKIRLLIAQAAVSTNEFGKKRQSLLNRFLQNI